MDKKLAHQAVVRDSAPVSSVKMVANVKYGELVHVQVFCPGIVCPGLVFSKPFVSVTSTNRQQVMELSCFVLTSHTKGFNVCIAAVYVLCMLTTRSPCVMLAGELCERLSLVLCKHFE